MNKLEEKRKAILGKLLINSVFDGWTEKTLLHSARQLEVDDKELYTIFPSGIDDAVEYFSEQKLQMLDSYAKKIKDEKGLSNRITKIILMHLEDNNLHKASIKKLIYYYSLPFNYLSGITNLYKFIDKVWIVSGDRSFDFSYYTKRLTLTNIYLLTILYWTHETSSDMKGTSNFLMRRMKEISLIPKIKNKVRNTVNSLLQNV